MRWIGLFLWLLALLFSSCSKGHEDLLQEAETGWVGDSPLVGLATAALPSDFTTVDSCMEWERDTTVVLVEEGDGTLLQPYSLQQVFSGSHQDETCWVAGYVVGSLTGTSLQQARFGVEETAVTNLLVADNPWTRDVRLCAPVELPAGKVREALNLRDNPSLLYVRVVLKATVGSYFRVIGLKKVSSFTL